MAVDLTDFRAGMRRLAAGVNLITTVSPQGQRFGLTATAVCSVCAEPPTLLVCVNRNGASHAALLAAGVFAVNVLALGDRALADRFASPIAATEKFEHGAWASRSTGAPVLESASAAFDCRIAEAIAVGTHAVLFGRIEAIHLGAGDHAPLLYAHGDYGGFDAVARAVKPSRPPLAREWNWFEADTW